MGYRMEYIEHLQKVIDYIEENLCYEIDLASCAKAGSYSRYHFLRLFKYVTGLTPADYIRKRRLSEIAKEMVNGTCPIAELAFKYGFNSKENFIRAFKAEHHILPTEYKSAENSLKLYERIKFDNTEFFVIPKIIEIDDLYITAYKSDEDYIPNFWNKYNAKKLSQKLSGGKIVKDYGVSIWNKTENKVDYYCGIESSNAKGDISGTVELFINGGLYAVFSTPPSTHADFVNVIHKTWKFINCKWPNQSGYRHTGKAQFECYVEESRTYSEDIFIPIEKVKI